MTKTYVSDSEGKTRHLLYIEKTLAELFRQTAAKTEITAGGGRAELVASVDPVLEPLLLDEIYDKAADVLTVAYKYDFLSPRIAPKGLTESECELLLAAVISADYQEDKRYVYKKLFEYESVALDGFYNFRLKPLREKWAEIASCMPRAFFPEELKDFVRYLNADSPKKVYVDKKSVYDGHFNKKRLTELLPVRPLSLTREVLLSGAGKLELLGEIGGSDEKYLKSYFGDKITFGGNFLSPTP